MVSGKSHLSLQAPANRAGSAADAVRPETELTLIAEVQEADMKDAIRQIRSNKRVLTICEPIVIFRKGKEL